MGPLVVQMRVGADGILGEPEESFDALVPDPAEADTADLPAGRRAILEAVDAAARVVPGSLISVVVPSQQVAALYDA